MCILTLRVLINLLVGYKVSNVLDQKWAGLRQFPHVRDFFQKILILLISFYFYLFDGKWLGFDFCLVDMGVAPAQNLYHMDLWEGRAVPLDKGMVGEKIVHMVYQNII